MNKCKCKGGQMKKVKKGEMERGMEEGSDGWMERHKAICHVRTG